MKKTFIFTRTYVYGEPLRVFQISEYFVGRKSDAFIHGMATCPAVKSNTFRHGRQGFDATCVACVRESVRAPTRPISVHIQSEGLVLQTFQ